MDFSDVTVLVLGDAMLDHYIAGSVSRISPEAPVPVVSRQRAWTVPGGAANVARGLARLGCRARLVALAGHDAAGNTLAQEIAAEGIEAGLVTSARRPTSCKTRIMARDQQLLRVDEEVALPPDLEETIGLRRNLEKYFAGADCLILSDYAKGVLLRDASGKSLCAEAISMAADSRIPVLVDPKGSDWSRYAGAQCVTPNKAEFAQICQINDLPAGSHASLDRAAGDLCRRYDLGHLLLTRGSRGMILFTPGERPDTIPAAKREVADVSGAGDTVIATLAACVAKGLDWSRSAAIANAAAGVAVGKVGTAPVGIEELNEALGSADNPKLFELPQLVQKLAEWRRQGNRIVFTNGCFDLLHPGHISLLRQSAGMGDRLVVGLNSDSSVRRLKGSERPIQNQESRALLLSALQAVDAVVIFEEDTPAKLIEQIRPEVLVKGSDYDPEKIVGGDFVRSYGGTVAVVDLVEGCSTSGIVRRIRPESCQ